MNIGTAIKFLRKQKGLGQKDLAEMCNISVNALSQIETNVTFPQKTTIEKICHALDIPVSYLLFFSICDEDVPDDKRAFFGMLKTSVKSLIIDSITKDN